MNTPEQIRERIISERKECTNQYISCIDAYLIQHEREYFHAIDKPILEIKKNKLNERVMLYRGKDDYHPDTLDDAVKILKNAGWNIEKVDITKKKFFGFFTEKYSVLQIVSKVESQQIKN